MLFLSVCNLVFLELLKKRKFGFITINYVEDVPFACHSYSNINYFF